MLNATGNKLWIGAMYFFRKCWNIRNENTLIFCTDMHHRTTETGQENLNLDVLVFEIFRRGAYLPGLVPSDYRLFELI